MPSLSITVVSDIVCPWCMIGSRRLDQALASFPDVSADLEYHPFLLDPSTPPEGVDLRERLRSKYGIAPETMFARVEAAAHESGIPLDFAVVQRGVGTIAAHTLLRHARAKGTQRALAGALFDAYFLEGRDVSAIEVLTAIAIAHGFSRDEATDLVRDERELHATRISADAMAAQGVSGVPFFVFAKRLALSGAQPVGTMRAAIERATVAIRT